MAEIELEGSCHVIRWVSKNKVIRDQITQAIIGVFPQAFELKPALAARPAKNGKPFRAARPPEAYLSAGWPEFYGGVQQNNLRDAARAIALGVNAQRGSGGAFVVGQVERIKSESLLFGSKIDIIHSGEKKNPSYVKVFGIGIENKILHAKLASSSWSRTLDADDLL